MTSGSLIFGDNLHAGTSEGLQITVQSPYNHMGLFWLRICNHPEAQTRVKLHLLIQSITSLTAEIALEYFIA